MNCLYAQGFSGAARRTTKSLDVKHFLRTKEILKVRQRWEM